MPPSPVGRWPQRSRPADRGHRRRGGHDPRRPPARAVPERPGPVRTGRCARRSPPSTMPAASPSRPTRSCPTRCAPRARTLRRLLDDPDPARPSGRPRDVQSDGPRPAVARSRRPVRRRARPRRRSATATPMPSTRSAWAGRRSRAGPRPTCGAAHRRGHDRASTASFHGASGQLGTFGEQLRKRAPRCPRRAARAGPPGRHRSRPRLPRRPRAAATLRRRVEREPAHEDRPRLPVHLPGGGRGRPARPVPVREPAPGAATTSGSSPPATAPQRSSEGDIIRLGVGFSVRTNGSVGTLTFSPRYISQVRRPAGARAVRPPPLPRAVRAVPVAVPAARVDERERRDLPRLRRLLAVVRARQPGDAGLRGAAPRPDRGQRRGAPLHRPLLPGRLQGHPQRRRHPPLRQRGPDRALAGRRRPTCCSSVATSRARACWTS